MQNNLTSQHPAYDYFLSQMSQNSSISKANIAKKIEKDSNQDAVKQLPTSISREVAYDGMQDKLQANLAKLGITNLGISTEYMNASSDIDVLLNFMDDLVSYMSNLDSYRNELKLEDGKFSLKADNNFPSPMEVTKNQKDLDSLIKTFRGNLSNEVAESITGAFDHDFKIQGMAQLSLKNMAKKMGKDAGPEYRVEAKNVQKPKEMMVRFLKSIENVITLGSNDANREDLTPSELSHSFGSARRDALNNSGKDSLDKHIESHYNFGSNQENPFETVSIDKFFIQDATRNLLENALRGKAEDSKAQLNVEFKEESHSKFLEITVSNQLADPDKFRELKILEKLNNAEQVTTKANPTATNGTFSKYLSQTINHIPEASIGRSLDGDIFSVKIKYPV